MSVTVALTVACAVLGLVVGSFLNVLVWRVPRKESVIRPRSHCPSCGTQLSGRDNVPVVSWVLLRGRCRTCSTRISARNPLLEVTCAAVFAGTAAYFGLSYRLPAYLVLGASLIALSAIDFEHKLLPSKIIFPTGFLVAALLLVAALAESEPRRIVWSAIGAAGSFGLFFALHFISPRGMAYGDVRLSFVLGMAVGWIGLGLVPFFLFVSFLVSAVTGVIWAVVTRQGLKAAIPFGPFLALGAGIAIFVGRPMVDAYLGT